MEAEPLRADMHVHTDHSKDSRTSPREVVKRALELGLDAIAVTDHNTVSGALEAERAAEGTGLLVIPGQEVRSREGEVIVLNVRETIPHGMSCLQTMRVGKKMGGFVVVPHPFDLMRNGLGKSMQGCLRYIDAIEVFNARTILGMFNNKAMSFAQEHNLPITAGSDSHFPEEMGNTHMLINSAKTTKAILEAIASGKAEIVARKQSLPRGIKRGLLKIRTYF
jgi:predicted metal-dependent phosphoesterase TrpH